jgi:hypothetical protein
MFYSSDRIGPIRAFKERVDIGLVRFDVDSTLTWDRG